MCGTCYAKAGWPTIDTPKVRRLAALLDGFDDVIASPLNPINQNWNADDWVVERVAAELKTDETWRNCADACELMKALQEATEAERYSAICLYDYHRFLTPEETGPA